MVEAGEQGRGREQVDAGGGELEGEGEAVEAPADGGDLCGVVLR